MMARQKVGFAIMILFLPINGPLLRMGMESIGTPIPLGEFHFFILSILLFSTGATLAMTPKIRFFHRE
tara:strand:- start:240 stop:443 length:204 start_codon:yes stop_codon:yes gene_type:complete